MTIAAARLFHRRGYHGVSVADVAAEVGMTGPAIYRHFGSKQGLLVAAIKSGLDQVDHSLRIGATGDGLPLVIDQVAGVILQRKDLWSLYQREARHLDFDSRAELVAAFEDLLGRFTAAVAEARPGRAVHSIELSVYACLAVLASPSVTPVRMPLRRYRTELSEIAVRVAMMDDSPRAVRMRSTPRPAEVDLVWEGGTEGRILAAATRLFQDRGYRAVGVDDIAAQVGMAGPSVYHHFPGKAELLVRVLGHATDLLSRNRCRARETATTDLDRLRAMVRGYVELAVRHRGLFDVYVTEVKYLPRRAERMIATAIRSDVECWSGLLERVRPDLDPQSVLLRVFAARAVTTDLIRVGQLHARPTFIDAVDGIAASVLFD
jgi:AcrR family transcriptional regulator